MRRIGHAGTLDPAAVGVLPVALGRATRTLSSPEWDVKEYLADVRFGFATATDDAAGNVIATADPSHVDLDAIRRALPSFLGTIRQRPPAYSAVHVGGERAYRQARRGLLTEIPERSVQVDAIAIVGWRPHVLSLRIQCRSGTYIRSMARDLGTAIGCPAHVSALVRLRVGPFVLRDALGLADLEALEATSAWERVLWPFDVACRHLDAMLVPAARQADVANGRAWPAAVPEPTSSDDQTVRVYEHEGGLLGLATRRNGLWQPTRGLRPSGAMAA
jgi:tRNA pseudouridine55 synthase